MVKGGDIGRVQSFVAKVISLLNYIPVLKKNPYFVAVTLATNFALSVGSTFGDDRDALYTIDTYNYFGKKTYDKTLFKSSFCGATVANLKPSGYVVPYLKSPLPVVNYLRLKYLVPLFGTKNKFADDDITISIYSDSVKTLV